MRAPGMGPPQHPQISPAPLQTGPLLLARALSCPEVLSPTVPHWGQNIPHIASRYQAPPEEKEAERLAGAGRAGEDLQGPGTWAAVC